MNIDQLTVAVKEKMLQEGTCPPTVIVESNDAGKDFIPLHWDSDLDTAGRARIFFRAGRKYGSQKKNQTRGITALYFASEGWAAPSSGGAVKSQPPQRKRVVQIAQMGEGDGVQHTVHVFEVTRQAETIELLHVPEYTKGGEGFLSPLLPAFMIGVLTAKKGLRESDAVHRLRQILLEYERLLYKTGML